MVVQRTPHQRTYRPLNADEQDRLRLALQSYVNPDPGRWPWDPVKVIWFLFETGAHPAVVAHPSVWKLRVESGRTGDSVKWDRPKTKVTVTLPVSPALKEWLSQFIEDLKQAEPKRHLWVAQKYRTKDGVEHTRQQDNCALLVVRMVIQVCKELGLEGLSARGLRHTFAKRVYDASGHDIIAVQKKTRTSVRVAMRYAEAIEDSVDEKIAKGQF
jgi:integrase